jgi:uncharacterized membrane protein YgaE (UPF0421/DUF939 family)
MDHQPATNALIAGGPQTGAQSQVLGHGQPFFAPASALIVLGVTQGQRLQRAVEIVVGVAVGVLVADLITRALGPQTIWSLMTVTLLTLTTAIFLGGGPLLAVQATVSALYVTVVAPPGGGFVPTRFVDALVGGALALLVNQLPLHRDPMVTLLSEAGKLLDTLSALLVDIADALAAHDTHAARAALEQRALPIQQSRRLRPPWTSGRTHYG